MTLRPFFGYYGGKWRDTPRNYPAPTHGTIVEPFAGSAGYALRYPDRQVMLYDLDPVIAGLWSYLIRVTPSEILSIPDVPLSGSLDDLQGLCEEARWLVGFWLNKGNASPCKTPSSWMRTGNYPNSFWGDRVRATIAGQLEYIQHWQVRHGSYADIDHPGEATWFIDPPYQKAGKYYRFGSKGIDYDALGAWCKTRRGQVIVCEASGADWLPFQELAAIKTTRKDRTAREALWLA